MDNNIAKTLFLRQVGVVGAESTLISVRQRLRSCGSLFWKNLYGHYGCVNALEFDKSGAWMASGGDDRRILIWNVEKSIDDSPIMPTAMQGEHDSNIFCLGFDADVKNIFSGGNDERVLVHDLSTAEFVNQYLHEEPVFGISCHPGLII